MASLQLDDGTLVPVTPEYLEHYKQLSEEDQVAETVRLEAEQKSKQGAASVVEGEPAAAQAAPSAPETPVGHVGGDVGTLEDIGRSTLTGLRSGIEGIPGTPGDTLNLLGKGGAWLAGKLGAGEGVQSTIADYAKPDYLPTSADIHDFTTNTLGVGESYTPQTTAGKFFRTAAEFAPGFVSPSGGLLKAGERLAIGAGVGAASEGAGEIASKIAPNTMLEPVVRAVTGIVGGAGAEAGTAVRAGAKSAPARAAEAAAEDAAKTQGVNLTKGQRSGDVTQQAQEQKMLHGSGGTWAQRRMQQRERENLEALKDKAGGLRDRAAPTRGATPTDSAANLNFSVRRRVEQAKREGGRKIESALSSGQMIDADRVRDLPDQLHAALTGPDHFVPEHVIDDLTPSAKKAVAAIERYAEQIKDPSKFPEISLAQAERLRRNIGRLEGANPEDKRALAAIMETYDDWLEGGVTDPAALAELQAGRKAYKEGVQVERPRGSPPGGKQVADIATKGHTEDTARLFKPNDAGEMSPSAIDALERLTKTGASSGELDQVRDSILSQLTTGDPGKVATRIDNFLAKNPTAAKLFTADQLDDLKNWGKTNKALVPDPKATNPSKSSYPIIKNAAEAAKKATVSGAATVGALIGGPVGAAVGASAGGAFNMAEGAANAMRAKRALAPANRDTLSEIAAKATPKGAGRAAPGSVQGAQTVTINDPEDPNDGETATVISTGKDGMKVRLSNGQEKIIGKHLVTP
jgi:hypothetical protein